MTLYFADREQGPKPRTSDVIDERVWGGLYVLISARLADDSFGWRFPDPCPDGYGPCGCDQRMMRLTAAAEIPDVEWPLSPEVVPPTPAIMDLLEFAAASVECPSRAAGILSSPTII